MYNSIINNESIIINLHQLKMCLYVKIKVGKNLLAQK